MRALTVLVPSLVRSRLGLLRMTPFDQATSDGRSQERHRRIALSAAASSLSKVLALASSLLSIPLALNYLGAERFGIWSTLSTLIVALQFADLGIGNGVINAVSAAHGQSDRAQIRRYVSSALMALAIVGMILLAAIPALVLLPDWTMLFKLKEPVAIAEIKGAMAVCLACIALAVPLGLVHRVQIGLQKGFVASLWQCGANVLGLLSIWAATRLELGLAWLVLALLGAPLLTALANGVLFFCRTDRDLLPAPSWVATPAVRRLLSTGGRFLLLQVAAAVVLSSDSLVIAYVLGASEVAVFALPEKLFSIVSVLLATALSPLWPAYSEALARGDVAWAMRTLKRSLAFAVITAALVSAALLAIGPWLIHAWVGAHVQVSERLIWLLAVWKIVESAGVALAMFLNGAGVLRMQVIAAMSMVISVLVVKPQVVRAWGVEGAPLSTTAIYVVCCLLPLLVMLPGVVRSLRARHPIHAE